MNNLSIEELKEAQVTYKVKRDLVAVAIIDELISIREAQGVDAFANYKKLESEKSGSTLSLEMSIAAKVFAANLRAGRKE